MKITQIFEINALERLYEIKYIIIFVRFTQKLKVASVMEEQNNRL